MKGLTKEQIIIMINTLYKEDSSLILLSDLTDKFEEYGDEYYTDRGITEWKLTAKNPHWRRG